MVKITLPGDHPDPNGVVGGIQFTDGKAEVYDLGPNARTFLKALGARIRSPRVAPVES